MLAGIAQAAMFFVAHGGQPNQIASSTRLAPTLDATNSGCGRNRGCPLPPAQIRTCRITAYGSCLRYVTHRNEPPGKDVRCGWWA